MFNTIRVVADQADGVTTQAVDAQFFRILFGIDFGSASLAAARWAAANIEPHAHAVLAHVVPPFATEPDGTDAPSSPKRSLQRISPALIGGLGGFAATLAVASTRSVVRVGSPSHWLSAVADDNDASLVVLGRRSDANRVRVGEPNVIERTTRRTSASVLVVPEGIAQPPAHVIAAVDESPFATRVLDVARRLARLHEIPLLVLHVVSPADGAYQRVMRTAKRWLDAGKEQRAESGASSPTVPSRTARWLAQLSRWYMVDARDRTEVIVGDPARELTAAAVTNEKSVVVVGVRGSDQAPPRSVGSVARELLTRAPVPVLAVHV